MNKKGQVLVVFVLILPLIIMFLGLIIDIGNSLVIRKKYENIIKDIILYNYKEVENQNNNLPAGDEIDDNNQETDSSDESIVEVDLDKIERNIKDSIEDYDEVTLKIKDDVLNVNVKSHYKSIFASIFNIGLNNIDLNIKYDVKTKRIVRE